MLKNGSDMSFEGCIVQNYIKIFDCLLTTGIFSVFQMEITMLLLELKTS